MADKTLQEMQQLAEVRRRINELKADENKLTQQQKDLLGLLLVAEEKLLEKQRESDDWEQKQIDNTENRRKALLKIVEVLGKEEEIQQKKGTLQEQLLKLTIEQERAEIAHEASLAAILKNKTEIEQVEKRIAKAINEGTTDGEAEQKLIDLKTENKALEEKARLTGLIAEQEKEANQAGTDSFTNFMNILGVKTEKQKLSFNEQLIAGKVNTAQAAESARQFLTSGVALRNLYASVAMKVLEVTMVMAKQLDVVRSETYKAAGGFTELGDQVMAASETAGAAGLSFEAMSQSYGSLIKNSSNFTELTKSQRAAVATNTAQLTQLGISADVASKNFSLFTQSLGMTAAQANASSRELVSLASNLHMSFEEISAGFGQAATTVAAYGQGAVREFSRLAAESKALGLSVQELINIVKGADTFQGAAEQAGKLNAMLGGGLLNSSQLLVASESERIQLIRDAVMQTGRSFSTMSKYEQIAIANAAGIQDLTVAQKLFNQEISGSELDRYLGKTNALGLSQEQLQDNAAAARQTTENFKIIMEQFAAAISPVVNMVAAVVGWFTKYSFIIKILSTVIMSLIAFKYAYLAVTTLLNIKTAFSTALTAADTLKTGASVGVKYSAALATAVLGRTMDATAISAGRAALYIGLVVFALVALYMIFHKAGSPMLYAIFGFVALGILFMGEAAEKNKKGLLAFGAAMLMVGTGAFLAFHGLEGFATALSALDPAQLAALVAVIVILALTMVVLFAIVISAGSAAVGPMLALGVAFLLIGAGAYLAGLGLSLVVNAFANLATNIVALLLLPLFLQLMAVGFIALTISLYAFGTTLPIIMLAIPLLFGLGIVLGTIAAAMLVAAIASVIFGGGLMLIGSALSNFTVGAAAGIIAVAGSLLILQYSLIAIGASMIAFYIPILAAISMIGLLGLALATISPEKSIALKTTTDSIRNFVDTGKSITPETVSNLDEVVKQIHKLNVEATISKAVNVVAPFKELIDAINGQTAANAAGKETTVVMKLNDREFGRAVVGVMNEYGTNNTVLRKPTPA